MKRLFLVLTAVFLLISANAFAADVTLTWDANTETDLAGYRVYNGAESRTYGEPVDAGNVTVYQVTVPDGEAMYFAVTAYDTEGLESDYSNEVNTNGKPAAPGITITVTVTIINP